MRRDAGKQGLAPVKDDDKQVADCGRVAYLQQRRNQICPIEQIHDMPDAKGDGAYHDRASDIVLGHHLKQKASKNDFLDKADIKHGRYMAYDFARGMAGIKAGPQIYRCDKQQGNKIQISLCVYCASQAVVGRAVRADHQRH